MVENPRTNAQPAFDLFINLDETEFQQLIAHVKRYSAAQETLQSFNALNLKKDFDKYCDQFDSKFFEIDMSEAKANQTLLNNLKDRFGSKGKTLGNRIAGYTFELLSYAYLRTTDEYRELLSPDETREKLEKVYKAMNANKSVAKYDISLGLKRNQYTLDIEGKPQTLLIPDGIMFTKNNDAVLFEYKANLNINNAEKAQDLSPTLVTQAAAQKKYIEFMDLWKFKKVVYVVGDRGKRSEKYDGLAIEELKKTIDGVEIIYMPIPTKVLSEVTNSFYADYVQNLNANT